MDLKRAERAMQKMHGNPIHAPEFYEEEAMRDDTNDSINEDERVKGTEKAHSLARRFERLFRKFAQLDAMTDEDRRAWLRRAHERYEHRSPENSELDAPREGKEQSR